MANYITAEHPRIESPDSPGILAVSHTHEAILAYMLAVPTASLGEVAAHFGYTQPWLSNIIHSDCFQAELAKRQDEFFGEIRVTVKDRLTALAHDSLARLQKQLEVEPRTEIIQDVAEMAIKALGFIGQSNGRPTTQVNVYAGSVDRQTLADARARMESRDDGIRRLEVKPQSLVDGMATLERDSA